MSKLEKPSALEVIAGNPATSLAATAFAALAAGPLAALLPALAGTLAAQRQQERVRKAIEEIGKSLQEHESKLQEISDAQYKLMKKTPKIAAIILRRMGRRQSMWPVVFR